MEEPHCLGLFLQSTRSDYKSKQRDKLPLSSQIHADAIHHFIKHSTVVTIRGNYLIQTYPETLIHSPASGIPLS